MRYFISLADGNTADGLSGGNAPLCNGQSANDIEYYRARWDKAWHPTRWRHACEMDNQLQGEIPYLKEPIQIQIHVFEKCKYKMTVCPMKWTMKRTINYVGGEIPYLEKQIENLIWLKQIWDFCETQSSFSSRLSSEIFKMCNTF